MFVEPEEELWQELADVAESRGLFLYDLERQGTGGLRVFVGKRAADQKIGSPTSEECSDLCRRLNLLTAVNAEDWGLSAETPLEVSSPGVNRRLRLAEHFREACGERVKISAFVGDSSRGYRGLLKSFENEEIHLLSEEGGEEEIALSQISKARIDFKF